MKKIMLLAVVLALISPVLVMAGDDPMPTLPDYTKAPFAKGVDLGPMTSPDHPEWGVLSGVLYATGRKLVPGAQAVIVVSDQDGKLKYAQWHIVASSGEYLVYSFIHRDGKWVFKGVTHLKGETSPSDDTTQKS